MEIDAKIADNAHPTVGRPVNPHHISTAYRQLLREGLIAQQESDARGNRTVSTVYLPGRRNRTAVAAAAGRKRLLLTRYLGWSQGTPTRPGITGPAAEHVVHSSLLRAAPYGYRLMEPDGRPVGTFLGRPVPIGPLDNGALYSPVSSYGIPGQPVGLPVEVKNLRDWIYPNNSELYQLLTKAHRLAQMITEVPLVPVLVCRRAHATTFKMASDLGFFIIDARRHYIGPTAEENRIIEVRAGLGFLDLAHVPDHDDKIVRQFTRTLPRGLADRAARWSRTAAVEEFDELFNSLRTVTAATARTAVFAQLRRTATAARLRTGRGW